MARHFIGLTFFAVIYFNFVNCKIISKSEDRIFKEDDAATVWCGTEKAFSKCKWQLPDSSICEVGPEMKNCPSDHGITFNGSPTNCSIMVDQLAPDHSGSWQCIVESEILGSLRNVVHITVAVDPKVAIEDYFGTVVAIQGQMRNFACKAEKGRPMGKFRWQIGDSRDPEGIVTLTNSNPPIIEDLKDDYYTLTETLNYIANIKHHDRKLYCIYTILNENQKVIYESSDHVALNIHFLEEPRPEKIEIPPIQTGQNLTISLEFGAQPKPFASDVIWQISSKSNSVEIPTDDNSLISKQNYLAYPLKQLDENRYLAVLVIQNVEESELRLDHALKISSRSLKDSAPFHSVTHRFAVNVIPHNEQGGGIILDEVNTTSSTTIVVVIVVILLLALISGGLVFYAKRYEKWCFAPVASPKTPGERDPEVEAALDGDDDPNLRPIYNPKKHDFGRPK